MRKIPKTYALFLHRRYARRLDMALVLAAAFTTVLCAGAIFTFAKLREYRQELPNRGRIETKLRDRGENTVVYDRHGKVLYTFKDPYQDREYAEYREIPPVVIAATLAAEDKDFFLHQGIDYVGMLKGIVTTVQSGGQQIVGGSTITQQLIKQTVLTTERSVERKVKEAIITLIVEQEYTKEEILEFYLNTTNYGGRIVGIKTAARAYFGKTLDQLKLNEAVYLVSLVQSPGEFSPLYANDAVRAANLVNERRRWVLDQIKRNHRLLDYLTTKDLQVLQHAGGSVAGVATDKADALRNILTELQAKDINVGRRARDIINAPHWVFYIRDLLQQEPFNLSQHELYRGGYRIYTTLDLSAQQLFEAELKRSVDRLGPQYGFSNAGLVAIDARSGDILAMVGSKGYNLKRTPEFDPQVNTTVARNSLGSSLKPWMAYLALASGKYKQFSTVSDTPAIFPNDYIPKNADGQFMGEMSLHRALILSRNLPFIKLNAELGYRMLLDLMQSLGYAGTQRYGLSAVVGGVDETLLNHTAAYTGFATGGDVMYSRAITRVDSVEGKTLFKTRSQVRMRLDSEHISTVNRILGDRTYRWGIFSYKFVGNYKLAGKTGTSDSNKDTLYIGYSPELVVGVWAGNNNNKPMGKNAFGATISLPIWNACMQAFAAKYPSYMSRGNWN